MGLLDILAFPLLGPIKGVAWIAEKIVEQADKELYSEDAIRGKLLELELHYDLGEIKETEFMEAEENLLKLLRAARERQANDTE